MARKKRGNPVHGWLVLDKGIQDVGVFARFRCATGCKTGVLLRAEKTADGGLRGASHAAGGLPMHYGFSKREVMRTWRTSGWSGQR